jgi:acetyltransferase-like isoleucine patch superfamily enzyme
LLPEIKIGDYAIVGAGSIVTKSFEPYSIIAGNPAKLIAKRCKICLDKIKIDQDVCQACI